MQTLSERIENLDISVMRTARLADVNARRLYNAETLTPDERGRVEAVLDRVARGEIRSRATVPA